jgi:hypothetical protein
MKHYSMLILLAVAFALLPFYESSAASDLTTSGPQILSMPNRSSGPTHLEIEPAFTYGLEYEDNIDGDYDGKDRVSGWSNHYRPEVNISALSPRFSLGSNVALDIAEYTSEKNFNYVNQDYSLSLGYMPNERLEFSLGSGYVVTMNNSRYEDIGAIDPTDQYSSYKNKTTDFNGGFSYILTPRSSIGLTGTFDEYDSLTTNGSNFYSLMGVYTYSLSPRTSLLLNTTYFYYDFSGNDDTFDQDTIYYQYSNFSYEMKNYSITGGFEHMFENDGKLLAQFGLRYSDIVSREQTDTGTVKTSGNGNGWVGVLEYQKRFNDFLFGFEAHNDVSVSPEGANYNSTSFLSRTDYRITQRLSAGLSLRFVRAFADSSDDEFTGGNRDDNTYIVQSSLTYMAYRWLQTSIGHQYMYTQYKDTDSSIHWNLFYINLRFFPLRNLVLR